MQNYRQVPVTDIYYRNIQTDKEIILNVGGAGSSKSHSIAQVIITKFFSEKNKRFLITRKTLPSLKLSAMKLLIDLMKDYGYYKTCEHNKTDRVLTNDFGNYMYFGAIDDPEKIKSTEWDYQWLEEASDFNYEDFVQLKLRMNRSGGEPKMYLSLNPVDVHGWFNNQLMQEEELEVIRSSYKDNPFVSERFIKTLKNLKDENLYKIYTLGEYGIIQSLIFEFEQAAFPETAWTVYGLDWGFTNDPTALIKIGRKGDGIYLHELIYERGMTNADISGRMEGLNLDKEEEIIADSAEPKSIEELYRERWNIKGAKKGRDSVMYGIDIMKRFNLYITPESINLIKEFRNYKFQEDKNGNVLNKPVDAFNHGIDAARYACMEKIGQLEQEWFVI